MCWLIYRCVDFNRTHVACHVRFNSAVDASYGLSELWNENDPKEWKTIRLIVSYYIPKIIAQIMQNKLLHLQLLFVYNHDLAFDLFQKLTLPPQSVLTRSTDPINSW